MAHIISVCNADGDARFRSELERDGAELLHRAGVRELRFNVVPERAPAAGVTDVVSEADNVNIDWDGLRFHAGPGARQRVNVNGNGNARRLHASALHLGGPADSPGPRHRPGTPRGWREICAATCRVPV